MVDMLIHLTSMSSRWRWAPYRLMFLKTVQVFAGNNEMGFMKDSRQEGFAGNSLRMWKKGEGRALIQRKHWEIKKKEEIEIERSAPQQSETRLSTYEVVQLVPQDFYCISTPISATVELSHEHYLAQLHFQCCLPGCMLNCISETRK